MPGRSASITRVPSSTWLSTAGAHVSVLNVREGVAAGWSPNSFQEDPAFFAGTPSLDEVDKRYVQYVLSRTQGNISRAAKILDIDRRSLYRMLERFKIAPFHKESE
jgi:transcriptional regulator of acetoin/glycerol metabolism